MVHLFFKTYVLHEEKYARLRQTDANVLRRVQGKDCPAQHDGYICGIFAVAVVFHLAERKPLIMHSFSQNDVTKARSELAQAFAPTSAIIPRNVFRNCFPMLCGESTIDLSGAEIITPVHSIIRNTCNTRSIAFLGDSKSGLTAITLTSPQKSDNVHVSDDLAKPKLVLQQSEASQKKKRLHNEISLREKCPIALTLTPSSTISTTRSQWS